MNEENENTAKAITLHTLDEYRVIDQTSAFRGLRKFFRVYVNNENKNDIQLAKIHEEPDYDGHLFFKEMLAFALSCPEDLKRIANMCLYAYEQLTKDEENKTHDCTNCNDDWPVFEKGQNNG